jgi:acyl dehydratase
MKKTFKARLFTAHDQERFASLSGDFNPMHMDEAAARRTQAGTCAVHGVHAFLWALEQLAAAGYPLGRLTSARVDFTRFVRLAAPVTLDVCSHPAGQLRAELIQDERRVVGIDLAFANRRMPPREDPARRGHGTLPTAPVEPSLDDLRHARGSIEPPKGAETLAAELFPCTVAALGTGCTVSLGLLSSLVGMVAPGLHSIFSAIRIGFETGESRDWLRYEVASLDDRFRMVTVQVEGCGFAGSVGAFVRFPPVPPPRSAISRRRSAKGNSRGVAPLSSAVRAALARALRS